jgi:hypothetical protein
LDCVIVDLAYNCSSTYTAMSAPHSTWSSLLDGLCVYVSGRNAYGIVWGSRPRGLYNTGWSSANTLRSRSMESMASKQDDGTLSTSISQLADRKLQLTCFGLIHEAVVLGSDANDV